MGRWSLWGPVLLLWHLRLERLFVPPSQKVLPLPVSSQTEFHAEPLDGRGSVPVVCEQVGFAAVEQPKNGMSVVALLRRCPQRPGCPEALAFLEAEAHTGLGEVEVGLVLSKVEVLWRWQRRKN